MLKQLKPGDSVYVTSLHECARSIRTGIRLIRVFQKNKIKFVDLSLEKIKEDKDCNIYTHSKTWLGRVKLLMREQEKNDRVEKAKLDSEAPLDNTKASQALLQKIADLQVAGFTTNKALETLNVSNSVFEECVFNFTLLD